MLGQSTAPFADAARARAEKWAGRIVALGAAISCFGALNGWTLLVGQLRLPLRAMVCFRGSLRARRRETPAAGMIIAGILTTALVCLNYTRGLVELFTFFILTLDLEYADHTCSRHSQSS